MQVDIVKQSYIKIETHRKQTDREIKEKNLCNQPITREAVIGGTWHNGQQ